MADYRLQIILPLLPNTGAIEEGTLLLIYHGKPFAAEYGARPIR